MKKTTTLLLSMLVCLISFGQTTVLDFEAPGTTTNYLYFGNTSLDGTAANIIANPDPTGANTSATVIDFTKTAGALTFAGAYGDPAPSVIIDMITNDQICIKVWMDHLGSVSLKLEGSGTGDNWIQTVNNTVVNQWEELCIDATLPSFEAPFTAAAGHAYTQFVIFFDFGAAGTGTDVVSYWDDVTIAGGTGPVDQPVVFSVNMNDYPAPFNNVYVNGEWNAFCGTCNELFDADGDGIYTSDTLLIPSGNYEYLFTADSTYEAFDGTDECTNTTFDPPNVFRNRSVLITAPTTVPTACWESCYDCGAGVEITFEIGLNGATAGPGGVFLAGGGNFGNPGGDYQMNGPDAAGKYSITVERLPGFSSYYTFANDACPDYSCKEDISGQACADPANFNDRLLGPITGDTTIATCFGVCAINSDCDVPCDATTAPSGLSSMVGASSLTLSWNPVQGSKGCRVQGRPLGAPGFATQVIPIPEVGSATLPTSILAPGIYEWGVVCACEIVPLEITPLSALSQFIITAPRLSDDANLSIVPNPATDLVTVSFDLTVGGEAQLRIVDMLGRVVSAQQQMVTEGSNQIQLDVADLVSGLYLVEVQTSDLRIIEEIEILR